MKQRQWHWRRPAPYTVQHNIPRIIALGVTEHPPQCLLHHMGLDVDDPIALDGGIVVPCRALQRPAMHSFGQMMDRSDIDRRCRGLMGHERTKELWRVDHLCDQPGSET